MGEMDASPLAVAATLHACANEAEHRSRCDRQVADLSRPGTLTAGLNWYRANIGSVPAADRRAPASVQISCPAMGVWSGANQVCGSRCLPVVEIDLVGHRRQTARGVALHPDGHRDCAGFAAAFTILRDRLSCSPEDRSRIVRGEPAGPWGVWPGRVQSVPRPHCGGWGRTP